MDTPDFAIKTTAIGGGSFVLSVEGELDQDTTPALAEELVSFDTPGRRHVVIDLGSVTFLDSSALAVLMAASRRLVSQKCKLIVVTSDPHLRRLFALVGITEMLHLQDDLSDALESICDLEAEGHLVADA